MIAAVWQARLDWAHPNEPARRCASGTEAPARRAGDSRGGPSLIGLVRVGVWRPRSESSELACSLVAEAPEDLRGDGASREAGEGATRKGAATDRARGRAEIERDQARYRELYHRNQPRAMPRRWPAWPNAWAIPSKPIVFLTAALADEPDRADLREALRRLEEAAHEPDDGRPRKACSTGSRRTAARTCRRQQPRQIAALPFDDVPVARFGGIARCHVSDSGAICRFEADS